MARQLINIGTIENDGTGDKLRDAMDKINDNFQEVYTELGGDSLSNLDFSVNTISSANSNGDIILDPNGTGKVKVDNLAITGNTISSTDTNGNITIDPDGTGSIILSSDVSVTGTLTLSSSLSANVTGNLTGNVTGTVSSLSNHDTDNLSEGSGNLYFTTTRARESLSATGSISYDNSSGVISFTDAVTSVNGKTGAVTINLSDIASSGQLDGDIKGSVFGDDSTLLVNGTNNEIVGTINSASGTITALTSSGITMTAGGGINASTGVIQGEYFYGENAQVENYRAFDSTLLIDGTTGTIYGTIDNSLGASFSGTVDFNGATVTNLSLSTLESDLIGNVVGNVDGDLIGSVFGDDSTAIIDGINKTATLTELDVDDININGNTITATGSAPQSIVLNVSGFGALQTNSDSLVMASRTITDPLGASGDVDNILSQDDNYLYKSTAAYDGSTRIWKRAKLRDFADPLFYVGADDSTMRGVGDLEGIKIIGGTNVTTTSDAEGNITVNSSATGNVVDDTTPQLGGDLDLNGHSITTARSNEDLNLTPNGTGTVTINGGLKLEEGTQEKFSSLTSATGTVTHDCSNGTIFYHTSISADFTANFTNLQLDSAYATTVSLVLVQGASEFIPTAVQIAGAAQTINWQGGLEPTGTDNGIDVVSFTILNNSGTYTVLAQLVDFT